MTALALQLHPFDPAQGQRGALQQAALAITATDFSEHGDDMLVLALHPMRDSRKVLASHGNSAIRAAISVAVAAGNTRAWSAVDGDGIVDVPVGSLPEIIRASVEPYGIQSVHVGAVRDGAEIECYTMWLSNSALAGPEARARHLAVLRQLRSAVEHDRLEEIDVAQDEVVPRPAPADADLLSALADRGQFDITISDLRADEAAVLVIGIDDADAIRADHGSEGIRLARQVVAGRLASSVRKHDVIGYVADDTFALILANVDRHTAFEISRRLRSGLSEPMPDELGGVTLSISVGLSHETGLIDPAEMFEGAHAAMLDARLEGGARMLIAC